MFMLMFISVSFCNTIVIDIIIYYINYILIDALKGHSDDFLTFDYCIIF